MDDVRDGAPSLVVRKPTVALDLSERSASSKSKVMATGLESLARCGSPPFLSGVSPNCVHYRASPWGEARSLVPVPADR